MEKALSFISGGGDLSELGAQIEPLLNMLFAVPPEQLQALLKQAMPNSDITITRGTHNGKLAIQLILHKGAKQ